MLDDLVYEECDVLMPNGDIVTCFKIKPPPPMDYYPSADCIAGLISEDA